MEIDTQLPLRQLEVYVLRDFEAEKKLAAKDPKAYGVGEIRFLEKDVQEINTPGTYRSVTTAPNALQIQRRNLLRSLIAYFGQKSTELEYSILHR